MSGQIRPIPVFKLEMRIAHICGHCSYQGESNSSLGMTHREIIERSYWRDDQAFSFYGAKGVRVCREWLESFQNFKKWALANGYEKGKTIDRIDSTGDYTPDNCRWTDRFVQNQNRSNSILIEFEGETKTAAEWSRAKGISSQTVLYR